MEEFQRSSKELEEELERDVDRAEKEKEKAKDKGKEKAKRFPAGVPLDGVFAMDPVKEAQLAREREALKSDTRVEIGSGTRQWPR